MFATLGVALYAWMSGARSVEFYRSMPNFSRSDVGRLLFVYGESERHLYPDRLKPNDAPGATLDAGRATLELMDEAAELAKSENRYERRMSARLKDVQQSMLVVLAGWGRAEPLESLRTIGVDGLPDYLVARANEILLGDEALDRARAERSRRYHAVVRAVRWALIGFGPLALAALWLKRREQSSFARGIVPLGLLWSLVVFVWAKAGADALERLVSIGLEWHTALPYFVAWIRAGTVVALLHATWGRGVDAPLARMLAIPNDVAQRLRLVLVGVAAGGLCLGSAELIHDTASWLHVYVREFLTGMVAPVVFGDAFAVGLKVVDNVVGAPLAEEILFRGVLFGGLVRRLGLLPAALVSSAVFAVIHGYALVPSFIIAAYGCIFCFAYARTGSLIPSMIAHGLINLVIDAHSFGYRFDVG